MIEMSEFFQDIKTPATIVHVCAVVIGMGGALVSDILFSFFSKDKKLNKTEVATLSVLANVVLYSLVLISLSGVALFFSDVEKYMASPKFLAKMSIVVVLLINGWVLNTHVWPHLLNKGFFSTKKERGVRRIAFACGAISVISWLSICTLGVLDSVTVNYESILLLYLFITAGGIVLSLIVEKKELD